MIVQNLAEDSKNNYINRKSNSVFNEVEILIQKLDRTKRKYFKIVKFSLQVRSTLRSQKFSIAYLEESIYEKLALPQPNIKNSSLNTPFRIFKNFLTQIEVDLAEKNKQKVSNTKKLRKLIEETHDRLETGDKSQIVENETINIINIELSPRKPDSSYNYIIYRKRSLGEKEFSKKRKISHHRNKSDEVLCKFFILN